MKIILFYFILYNILAQQKITEYQNLLKKISDYVLKLVR